MDRLEIHQIYVAPMIPNRSPKDLEPALTAHSPSYREGLEPLLVGGVFWALEPELPLLLDVILVMYERLEDEDEVEVGRE